MKILCSPCKLPKALFLSEASHSRGDTKESVLVAQSIQEETEMQEEGLLSSPAEPPPSSARSAAA